MLGTPSWHQFKELRSLRMCLASSIPPDRIWNLLNRVQAARAGHDRFLREEKKAAAAGSSGDSDIRDSCAERRHWASGRQRQPAPGGPPPLL